MPETRVRCRCLYIFKFMAWEALINTGPFLHTETLNVYLLLVFYDKPHA